MEPLFSENALETITLVWLLLGAAFITLEAFGIPGVGFLFAGLSALTVGGLLTFGRVDPSLITEQVGWFFLFSFLWAVVLWYPLKRHRNSSGQTSYENMVGETAVVTDGDLSSERPGKIKWSGTIMTARLDESSEQSSISSGNEVTIQRIDGSTAYVTVKNTSALSSPLTDNK